MPTTYRIPADPTPPPAHEPLVDPSVALHLVAALFCDPPRAQTAVIWLAADRTGYGCFCVDDADSPDDAVMVARLAAAAASAGRRPSAVVIATNRPGWGPGVDDCDTCCFEIMEEALKAAGVVLVDWFVVDRGEAVSVAEHLGRPSRWKP